MPKYRDYFRQMLEKHQEEFGAFADVHTKYSQNRIKWQDEFNKQGAVVMEIIREWESRLCGHSERGQFAKFSSTLADKFWEEVKAFFPMIDFVGVKITKPALRQTESKPSQQLPVKQVDRDLKEIDEIDGVDDFVIKRLF